MDIRVNRIIEILKKWESSDDAILHDGTILICRNSFKTPLGYLHKVFPPINTLDIEKIEALLKVNLPEEYLDFLLSCNGMELFGGNLSIFGLRKNKDEAHFDRFFQPKDIIIENLGRNYQDDYLKFASYQEDYDLFFKRGDQNKVYVITKDSDDVVKEYDSFYDWLDHSIEMLSKYYNESGKLVKERQLFKAGFKFFFNEII